MANQLINEFRISIAIEDEKTGGMLLLVANEVPRNSIVLEENIGAKVPGRDLLPARMEGSLTCTRATWLRIKNEAMNQGATWTPGTTKMKSTYWTSKPKVTVIHVVHNGISQGQDPAFSFDGTRLIGQIDDRVIKVVVRDRFEPKPIEGL